MNATPLSQPDPYAQIAELYDLEHDEFLDDLDLLFQLLEEYPGPVIEMGCGSGRVLVPLAESGLEVHGVDLSEPMLERAQARANAAGATVHLHRIAMDGVASLEAGPFGAVLFTLNALTHLDEQNSQLRALEAAQSALVSGGLLFLDLPNPTPDYLLRLADHRLLEWSGTLDDGTSIDKWTYRNIDPIEQLIDTTIWYDLLGPHGTTRTVRTNFALRYVHQGEMIQMLNRVGFEQVSFHGSYLLDPLQADSDRMVITAVKS